MGIDEKELSLQEIQFASLEVLLKVDELCKKLDLKYCLMYGTLLGAIRHNGFIPWDDDLDILMSRREISILRQYMLDHEKEMYPLKFCCRENTTNYHFYIPRITDMRYKYVNVMEKEKRYDIGVFIDIYTLDSFCNNKRDAEKLFKKTQRINSQYEIYVNEKSIRNKLRALLRYLVHIYLHIVKGENYSQLVNKEIDVIIEKNTSHNDRYVGVPTWGFGQLFERQWLNLENLVLHQFEGYQFPIPKEYKEVLTVIYGDYMKFPPEDQRIPHHNYKIYRRNN